MLNRSSLIRPGVRTATDDRTARNNAAVDHDLRVRIINPIRHLTILDRSTPTTQLRQPTPTFFTIKVGVRADAANNGWTNSGLVVRKGQRLRISASGRVSLGRGRFSTPGGVATIQDNDKLMRNEATGALIAVIGDDNDDLS